MQNCFTQVHSYSINDYITADRNSLYSPTVVRDLMNAKHFRKHPTVTLNTLAFVPPLALTMLPWYNIVCDEQGVLFMLI